MLTTATRFLPTLLVAFVALATTPAHAKDYFLTIGGGYNPTGNQISLEKNVLYFQRLLHDFGRDGDPHAIFFADGRHKGRDLQYEDPTFTGPRVLELLAVITNDTKGLRHQYRSHEVPHVKGPSDVRELDKWFDTVGPTLTPDDRVFIYATAHGGRGDNKTKHNTKLYLWNNQSIYVRDFVARLDKLPGDTPVVLVMVQCFAGGFANIIFEQGDPEKDLSPSRRCGFYATVHTRPAAGCTPDINEANYREYSTYFWEAIYGKTRLGDPVTRPDYDGDGRVSLAEAHGYTIIHSDTIDIPVKTSDELLRKFSKTEDKKIDGLLTPESKYDDLLATAGPIDTAVLNQLCERLKIEGDNRAKAARDRTKEDEDQRKKLAGEKSKLGKEYDAIRKRIYAALRSRWPEIGNRWHPRVEEAIQNEGDQIVKLIEGHREFNKLKELAQKQHDLETQRLDHERDWVKCQRVLRVLENVALAANLSKVAPDRQADYAALLERESAVLGPVAAE